jgi:hypothetical protein
MGAATAGHAGKTIAPPCYHFTILQLRITARPFVPI